MPNGRTIVLDTETTGVMSYDKLVALAAIRFDRGVYLDHIYRIYDPRKDCDPKAYKVHGWDDWTLRFQPLFTEEVDEVRGWLDWADCLVMHNAGFDLRYLYREIRKADRPPLDKRVFCTMAQAKARWPQHPYKLADCVGRFGLGTQHGRHDAFQDAFLTARLYFHMHEAPVPSWVGAWPVPSNLLPAPPPPIGEFPRRAQKRLGWRNAPPAPQKVQATEHSRRSFRSAVEAARDAQLLIRFIGVRADVPIDFQLAAVDAYSSHIAGASSIPLDEILRDALRESAMGMIGSQKGATTASKRLAADKDEMAVVLPILMSMIRRDGMLSEPEEDAMRHIFGVIRAAQTDRETAA